MAFLMGDTTGDDEEITEALLRLRKHLISEFSTEYTASVPKMVWKSRSTYQCLIRRTLEGVDGMRAAWNAGNLLTALTMGRSLIETGAVVSRLSDSVKDATVKRDVEALDRVVMNVGFGTRYDLFESEKEEHKALNILTMINQMDRSLFGDKTPRLRDAYDFLSEFAHPNHLGILGLYSDNFPETFRIEFGKTARKKQEIVDHLRITLGMILLVEQAASDFESMVPAIAEFVPK
jgi:hypothetical protein